MDESMAVGLAAFFSIVMITILTWIIILCCCFAYYHCCNCRKGERQDSGMTTEMSIPKEVVERFDERFVEVFDENHIPSDEPTAI